MSEGVSACLVALLLGCTVQAADHVAPCGSAEFVATVSAACRDHCASSGVASSKVDIRPSDTTGLCSMTAECACVIPNIGVSKIRR